MSIQSVAGWKIVTIIVVALSIFSVQCIFVNGQEKQIQEAITELNEETLLISNEEALTLLKTQCYACHNPATTSHDDLLAPPLAGIKSRCNKAFHGRADFISQMTDFISAPTAKKAMMKGPVRRFGVMPLTNLSIDQIQSITTYMYDNPIDLLNGSPGILKKNTENPGIRPGSELRHVQNIFL